MMMKTKTMKMMNRHKGVYRNPSCFEEKNTLMARSPGLFAKREKTAASLFYVFFPPSVSQFILSLLPSYE